MIRIMDNTKPLADLVNDSTNGLGCLNVLDDSIVTEELNGIYEAEFKIMVSEKHYADLSVDSIVKIPVNEAGDEQLFRVYFVSPEINGMVLVKAQHITYDLSKVAVEPFTATGAVAAKNGMLDHMMGTYPFNMTTDITNTTSNFKLSIPRSFRECLGGYEGSLLDVFRGEYEWDNLTVKMLAHRGADNGVRIAYGKNLTDFKQEMNNENVYTAVLGYAVVNEQTVYGSIYHKIVAAYPKVKIVDFSSDYSETVPTPEQLTAKAQTYAQNNSIEVPKVNITVSFVPLNQTEEYKNIAPLERVSLGDTVHVFFDKLGVEASSRVVKTVWNINAGRYDSIELGNTKANLNTVIDESVNDAIGEAMSSIDVDTSAVEAELATISQLIVNGLGLHITKDSIGRIYLHNAEKLVDSQYQYIITAQGFMLSDDYGQTWSSGWTASGDAVVNSLATITLKFLEGYGLYMRFGDTSSNYIDVAPYSDANDNPLGVSFDGSGYVRFRPQEQFLVNNLDSNSNLLNEFVLGSSGINNQAFVTLKNYDYTNHLLANAVDMDARIVRQTSSVNYYYNELKLKNYATSGVDSVLANEIILQTKTARDESLFQINNYIPSTTRLGNRLQFRAYNYTENGSTYKSNVVTLNNYKKDTESTANQIYMDASQACLRLYNYNKSSSFYANSFELSANSTIYNRCELVNYKKDTSSASNKANEIIMTGYAMNPGSSYANSFTINNYDVDGNGIADYIKMQKYSNRNIYELGLNRGGTRVAYLTLDRQGTEPGYLFARLGVEDNGGGYSYKSSYLVLTGAGIVNLDGEYQIAIGGMYANTELYLMSHKIYFSGGYVRYN